MEPTVPVNLSIKNAPDDVVQRLRERAQRNHRSLQGELMAIIEAAVRPVGRADTEGVSGRNPQTWAQLPSEAAAMVRADRDSGHRDHAKVIDTSAFVAITFDEPDAGLVVARLGDAELVAPRLLRIRIGECLPQEDATIPDAA